MSGVDVLVCLKRVPGASGTVVLSPDGQSVDTRHVGHTVSPHEECAVEAAVQVAEEHGGTAVVLTLGPEAALEQLRDALALGVNAAVHVVADSDGFGPADVAREIAAVVRDHAQDAETPRGYGLVLLGNDAADTGDFQVGIRLAYALGRPVVTGVRTFAVDIAAGRVRAVGDGPDGEETFDVPLPAVLTIKEGGISPRYPSIPGRLRAKRAPVEQRTPTAAPTGTGRVRLALPPEAPSQTQVIGHGADAAPALADLLASIGVVAR